MSSRELPVILTPEARDDFESISLGGLLEWGLEQARSYEASINHALQQLGRFPELGRTREEFFPGGRSLPVGQHVIFYRIDTAAVVVIRLLHAKRDSTGQFPK